MKEDGLLADDAAGRGQELAVFDALHGGLQGGTLYASLGRDVLVCPQAYRPCAAAILGSSGIHGAGCVVTCAAGGEPPGARQGPLQRRCGLSGGGGKVSRLPLVESYGLHGESVTFSKTIC